MIQPQLQPRPLVAQIIASLRVRYKGINLHYEAAWNDSWSFRRCCHTHQTLIEAAKCGMPQGAGWYVFAVESGAERELTAAEDRIVNDFRFGNPINTAEKHNDMQQEMQDGGWKLYPQPLRRFFESVFQLFRRSSGRK